MAKKTPTIATAPAPATQEMFVLGKAELEYIGIYLEECLAKEGKATRLALATQLNHCMNTIGQALQDGAMCTATNSNPESGAY